MNNRKDSLKEEHIQDSIAQSTSLAKKNHRINFVFEPFNKANKYFPKAFRQLSPNSKKLCIFTHYSKVNITFHLKLATCI
jgi:hypothetical protein